MINDLIDYYSKQLEALSKRLQHVKDFTDVERIEEHNDAITKGLRKLKNRMKINYAQIRKKHREGNSSIPKH